MEAVIELKKERLLSSEDAITFLWKKKYYKLHALVCQDKAPSEFVSRNVLLKKIIILFHDYWRRLSNQHHHNYLGFQILTNLFHYIAKENEEDLLVKLIENERIREYIGKRLEVLHNANVPYLTPTCLFRDFVDYKRGKLLKILGNAFPYAERSFEWHDGTTTLIHMAVEKRDIGTLDALLSYSSRWLRRDPMYFDEVDNHLPHPCMFHPMILAAREGDRAIVEYLLTTWKDTLWKEAMDAEGL